MLKEFSIRSGNSALPALAAMLLLNLVQIHAAVFWNESIGGDLSNNQASPSSLTLASGVNSVIGNVTGGTDTQDWIALTVPAGRQLSSVTLSAYTSIDAQGFTGFQAGSTFVGSPSLASSYWGYTHYGTGAQNGILPPVNLVGVDLLPLMADPAIAAGSQGFTAPLAAGDYVFLIQQLGASTGYQFDFAVTAVPEPCAQAAVAALCAAGYFLIRHVRSRSRPAA